MPWCVCVLVCVCAHFCPWKGWEVKGLGLESQTVLRCIASLLFIIGVTLINLSLSCLLCKKVMYTFVMVIVRTKRNFIETLLVVTFITVCMHACAHVSH